MCQKKSLTATGTGSTSSSAASSAWQTDADWAAGGKQQVARRPNDSDGLEHPSNVTRARAQEVTLPGAHASLHTLHVYEASAGVEVMLSTTAQFLTSVQLGRYSPLRRQGCLLSTALDLRGGVTKQHLVVLDCS